MLEPEAKAPRIRFAQTPRSGLVPGRGPRVSEKTLSTIALGIIGSVLAEGAASQPSIVVALKNLLINQRGHVIL